MFIIIAPISVAVNVTVFNVAMNIAINAAFNVTVNAINMISVNFLDDINNIQPF